MEIVSSSISPLSYNRTVTASSFTTSDFISSLVLSFSTAGTLTTGLLVIFVTGGLVFAESIRAGCVVLATGGLVTFRVVFFRTVRGGLLLIGGATLFTTVSFAGG